MIRQPVKPYQGPARPATAATRRRNTGGKRESHGGREPRFPRGPAAGSRDAGSDGAAGVDAAFGRRLPALLSCVSAAGGALTLASTSAFLPGLRRNLD